MNIFFDLDGTLIDSKYRLYNLFQALASSSQLTFDEYWSLKHARFSNQDILAKKLMYTHTNIEIFTDKWMSLIETPDYLALDTPFPNIERTLKTLSTQADLYVCTARQFEREALIQLEELKLLQYFRKAIVTGQYDSKESLISKQVSNIAVSDWMVGDTGKDVNTGHSLGINTCAVLSGFMSRQALEQYSPTTILNFASEFTLPNL